MQSHSSMILAILREVTQSEMNRESYIYLRNTSNYMEDSVSLFQHFIVIFHVNFPGCICIVISLDILPWMGVQDLAFLNLKV